MANDFEGLTSVMKFYMILLRENVHIMNIMLGMMKQSAIDCSLNLADNVVTNPELKCLNLGTVRGRNSYSSTPDITDELKEREQATRVERVKKTFKTLQFKRGGKTIKVSRFRDKIYDYDLVERITGQPKEKW